MMRQSELIERVQRYNPQANEVQLNRAYVYAMRVHGGQKRASGELFIGHPLEVAGILTDLKLDDSTIIAAILHDTVEDTEATLAEINKMFGEEIGQLVDGLTKIKRLELVSKQAVQAENLRKLLLAVASDVRVLLIKLADRLHNMRTIGHMPLEKRLRIAKETLDIYAPLAGRAGMQDMREELEELSFQIINPEAYESITKLLKDIRKDKSAIIDIIEKALQERMQAAGIKAEIKGRVKAPYSIFRKMESKSLAFEQLSDIFGFRVIVSTIPECYAALGVVHTSWKLVPSRFKDYISIPKQNDYRSLHTTVVGPRHQRVELQLRTYEMDSIAEYGVAAHSLYKDKRSATSPQQNTESAAYIGLRRTIEALAEGDPEEFLEHTKLELFHDQVFCFTPKGRLIALPRGATPIDFAYAVHTDIGDRAVGARVNGNQVPLISTLSNGDQVEIISAPGQVPPSAWENLVVTGKARASIRRATREAVRKQFSGLGRQIVERAFLRAGKDYSDKLLSAALHRLARASIEDVMASVGRGEMFSGNVLKAIYPDYREESGATTTTPEAPRTEGWVELKSAENLKFKMPQAEKDKPSIPIRGQSANMPVAFAPNGGAVPGDRIVGILTPGEGITIYPIQSPALADFDEEPERWLDVRWDIDPATRQRFKSTLSLQVINEPGSLASITKVIGDMGANIDAIEMRARSQDYREMDFTLEVWDLKHLNALITDLRRLPVVAEVERLYG